MKEVKKSSIQPERIVFYLFFAAILLSVFLIYAFRVAVPEIILVFFAAMIAVFGRREEILAMAFCTIPLYMVVPYSYIILVCMCVYIAKYGQEFRAGWGMLIVLPVLLWELIHCLDGSFYLVSYIGTCCPYVFCVILLYTDAEKADYSFVVRVFMLCTLVMSISVFGRYMSEFGYSLSLLFSNISRLGLLVDGDVETVLFNPNTLGYFCLLASMGVMQLLVTGRGNVMDAVIVVVILLVGVLTLSRTFFLCLTIMLILFAVRQGYSFRTFFKYALLYMAIASLLFLFFYVQFPVAAENMMFRFRTEDISGGRADLLRLYNGIIISRLRYLMYGVGLLDYQAEIDAIRGIANAQVPHNGFQEVTLAWGLPGLLLFVLYVVVIFRRSKVVNPHRNLLNCIPFFLLLIKVQAGQMITSYYTMMMYPMAYFSLIQNFGGVDKNALPEMDFNDMGGIRT